MSKLCLKLREKTLFEKVYISMKYTDNLSYLSIRSKNLQIPCPTQPFSLLLNCSLSQYGRHEHDKMHG